MGWMRFSFSFYILVDVIDFLHFPCFFADQTSGPWWKFTDYPYPCDHISIHPSAFETILRSCGEEVVWDDHAEGHLWGKPKRFLGGEESLMKRVEYVEWFEQFGFLSYQIFRAEGFWVKSCKSQCFLDKPRKIPRIRVLFVWHNRAEASVGKWEFCTKKTYLQTDSILYNFRISVYLQYIQSALGKKYSIYISY